MILGKLPNSLLDIITKNFIDDNKTFESSPYSTEVQTKQYYASYTFLFYVVQVIQGTNLLLSLVTLRSSLA